MKIKLKKCLILTFLSSILMSCSVGNNKSDSNDDSNSSNHSISNNKSEVSTNNNSSSIHEELNNFIIFDEIVNNSDWEIINSNPIYDKGIYLDNSDDSEIKLIKKHISLKKEKNYNIVFKVQGEGTLKVELLNNGKENIINGMNTSYSLTSSEKEHNFTFTPPGDYENIYLVFTVNGNMNLTYLKFDKINLYGDYEAPIFYGVENLDIYIDSKFDFRTNVKVIDNVDGDLTYKYKVETPNGAEINDKYANFSEPGEYKFIYSCSDKEDNLAIIERIVNVHEIMPVGHEFIKNGNFDKGFDLWYYDAYDGTAGTFSVVNEDGNNVLKAVITAIPEKGSYQPFPRLFYGKLGTQVIMDEMVIEKGCSYTLSFRIKGDVERTFQIVIGEVLDQQDENGNWTYYFAQEPSTYGWGLANRNITTEWQTITIDFTMALNYTNLNGCIGFMFGDCGDNPQTGTFYLDDISLVKR